MRKSFKRKIAAILVLLVSISLYLRWIQTGNIMDISLKTNDTSRALIVNKIAMRRDLNRTIHKWPWGQDSYQTEQKCLSKQYDLKLLPKASVIICFHESEEFEHLIHTIHSIVQHTPLQILQEIILIDDNSKKILHGSILNNYLTGTFQGLVRIIRNEGPQLLGIIKARLLGIRSARAPVAVVLDAHMEVREKWLQPLLYEISQNRRTIASITMDWMKPTDKGDWVYEHGPNDAIVAWFWKQFAFSLWVQASRENTNRMKEDPTRPFKNPATVGNWAVDRDFFEEIGALDEGMTLWGGENIDLAIRAYLWNGQVLGIPCSHAAHLEAPSQRSYRQSWGSATVINYKRIVQVWFDDYKDTFYYFNPDVKDVDPGDLTERMKLKVKCPNTFDAFLQNGYPQIGLPFNNTVCRGWLKCSGIRTHSMYWANPWTYGLRQYIDGDLEHQEFYLTNEGYLRSNLAFYTSEKRDNEIIFSSHTVFVKPDNEDSKWLHKKDGLLESLATGHCMKGVPGQEAVVMASCNSSDPLQQWTFSIYNDEYKQIETGSFKKNNYINQLHEFINKDL